MKFLAVLIIMTALGLFGTAFFGVYTAPGLEEPHRLAVDEDPGPYTVAIVGFPVDQPDLHPVAFPSPKRGIEGTAGERLADSQ